MLDIAFKQSQISHMRAMHPLRAYPNDDGIGDIPTATIVNISGGVVSGDIHKIKTVVEKDTSARLFNQSAEKVYSSYNNAKSEILTEIYVDHNSWFEWLPQETIIFNNAKLSRTIKVFLKKKAEALIGEMIVLGRVASQEQVKDVFLQDKIYLYKDSNLKWVDIILLDEIKNAKNSKSRLNNCNCFFTIMLSVNNPKKYIEYIEGRLSFFTEGEFISYTVVNEVIIFRGIFHEPLVMRKIFAKIWQELRSYKRGLPNKMPKLWWI